MNKPVTCNSQTCNSPKAKKNIGVILAGGSGRRLGGELPKQFIVIAGKTVLAHTLSTFENHEHIDEIVRLAASCNLSKQEIMEMVHFSLEEQG